MSLLKYSKTYKPFSYPWAMEIAESHEKIHWGSWEAKLQEDVNQWKGGKISKEEKNHITQILRQFKNRLNNSKQEEFNTACNEVEKIAGFRIQEIFNS